ncbi:pentapeptide repeat-containing protein [Agrobacterium sp. SORGH_AS 787]|uniref:pentapeptide repeat-containing protein n=1 Tax=Agrobacterium sp. SORGH_AS 787 TaxID=3041775 RepID=UPI00278533CD|nr:uncharacterized protein YjbI with pentapeptide repeats [Rhizobium sp. SORGH_AS_0787]
MSNLSDLQQLEEGETDLAGGDFSSEDLSYRELRGRNFHSAKLEGTNIVSSDLSDCNFTSALFIGVKAANAKFDGAKIASAILNCDFTLCSFRGASFAPSSMQGVDFTGADFRGASLADTTINEHCIFDEVKTDSSTDFSRAKVSRATSRQPIFSSYNYVDGRLQKKGNDTEDAAAAQRETLTGAYSASITRHLNSQPQGLAEMALALAVNVEAEIAREERSKPNDPAQLAGWELRVSFLSRLSNGLRELHESILAAIPRSEAPLERFQKPASVVARLRNELADWIASNSQEIVDSSSRLGLIGIGTAFMGLCGAPVTGSFAVTAALLGGPKVGAMISGAIKDAKGD